MHKSRTTKSNKKNIFKAENPILNHIQYQLDELMATFEMVHACLLSSQKRYTIIICNIIIIGYDDRSNVRSAHIDNGLDVYRSILKLYVNQLSEYVRVNCAHTHTHPKTLLLILLP